MKGDHQSACNRCEVMLLCDSLPTSVLCSLKKALEKGIHKEVCKRDITAHQLDQHVIPMNMLTRL